MAGLAAAFLPILSSWSVVQIKSYGLNRLRFASVHMQCCDFRWFFDYSNAGQPQNTLPLLDPFFEPAFQNSPLTPDLECWNPLVMDHAMQSSLGNLEYGRSLAYGQKFDGSFCVFHGAFCLLSPFLQL